MLKFLTTTLLTLCLATGAAAQNKKLLKSPLASPENVLWMTVSVSAWNIKKGDISGFAMCRVGKGGVVDLSCKSRQGYGVFLRGAAFDKNLHVMNHNKQLYYAAWTKPVSTGQHAFTGGKNGRHKFNVTNLTMVANIQPGTIVVNQRYAVSKSDQAKAMAKAKAAAIARFGDVAKGMKTVFMTPRAVSCDTATKTCELQ